MIVALYQTRQFDSAYVAIEFLINNWTYRHYLVVCHYTLLAPGLMSELTVILEKRKNDFL